jgi:23S rRNA pseudouridine2605 synthase
MTNDGDFCYRLTHPKFEIEKEYLVRVIGDFGAGECEKARRGVEDDGDNLKVRRIKVLEHNEKTSLLKVVTAEGKKRHLRRLFSGLGFGVVELKRIRIGGLGIGELGSGSYAMMKQEELAAKVFARKKTL